MSGSAPDFTLARPDERGSFATRRPAARGFVDWGRPPAVMTGGGDPRAVEVAAGGSDIRLNFVNVDLQDFARTVFEEVLHEDVIIDPALSGRITVRTNNPVSKKTVLTLVREALASAGATLSRPANVWRIGPPPGNATPRELVRVIPLRFINVADAKQALQPFVGGGAADVLASGTGKFLILAGRALDIETVERAVAALDVDELRARAYALIPLRRASAAPVAQDLVRMLGPEGTAQGVVIFPVERMNAVMVAAFDPGMLARVRHWTASLDQSGQDQRRIHVYPVKNRRAAELTRLLDGMLQGQIHADAGQPGIPGLGPQQGMFGTTPNTAPALDMTLGQKTVNTKPEASFGSVATGQGSDPSRDTSGNAYGAGGRGSSGSSASREARGPNGIEVRADVTTNSLVIVCRPEDYAVTAATIRRLDVLPTQVMIEATILEVRLNDTLRHGVRWFLRSRGHGLKRDEAEQSGGTIAGSDPVDLTYAFGIHSARVVVSALESVTDVEIISSPALTVLDNQMAVLKVGDQVPLATRSSRSVTTVDAPLVNDIEMKDTGVILQVTPRVNAGGLVTLDVKQEASDVVPTTSSKLDSPTIRLRQVMSTVAVKSGEEIMLGGIIQRNREWENDGIPILKDIPVLGKAFTSNAENMRGRTELIVIIRPTIMKNPTEVRAVTDVIKQRIARRHPHPAAEAGADVVP
ncbi:type II secretion system protein GspD [Methylobacterium mesophilicum]